MLRQKKRQPRGKGSAFYFRFPKKTASEIENGELKMEDELGPMVQPKVVQVAPILHSPFTVL
jgi:hypothetical protein